MQPRWYGILLAGWLAGCTSSAVPDEPPPIPDHFNDNLDVLTRGQGHPCGADFDLGDGQIVVHYRYTYDALGRLQRDIGTDPDGALYEQIDYTWDNAGHLTSQRDAAPGTGSLVIDTWLYDTLGRLMQTRSTTADTDATDDHQVANTRTTSDYTDHDALGHAAHASQLQENLDAGTSQKLNSSYGYDDLGRLTSVELRLASGDLLQSERRVFDDVARTITWQLDSPHGLTDTNPASYRAVEQYDSDGRWLATHQENRGSDGVVTITQDTVVTWDHDRELRELISFAPPDHAWTLHLSKTYRYQCDSAKAAIAPLGISPLGALPRAAFHRHP